MKLPLDRVLIGDTVAEMKKLPPCSVDVIFADPPYNLQLAGELHGVDEDAVEISKAERTVDEAGNSERVDHAEGARLARREHAQHQPADDDDRHAEGEQRAFAASPDVGRR